jgi:predicted lysophospholipase L1 biosynthesis ABC-type transport system permease subunit
MVVEADGISRSFLWSGVSVGRMSLVAHDVGAINGPVPVLVNPAFLAATGTLEGDTISATIDSRSRRLKIVGTVDTFPTTDPTRPLLVVDQATLDLLRLQASGQTRKADEWWLAVAPGAATSVVSALHAQPFDSPAVVGAEDRARSLSTDPVALGIIGALLLGFVATGVFSLVALVVSASVSARERRTEFALLRALGLSAGQLSRWLWLENGSLVLASLVGGTAVGLVISWLALPFITVTQQAATPVPSALVQVPWQRILVLDLVIVIALALAVGILAAVLRRIGVGSILRLGED